MLLLSCSKKEEADLCAGCPLYILNSTPYEVQVYINGVQKKKLASAEVYETSLTPGLNSTVKGDILTSFAHTDYEEKFFCPGAEPCETLTATIRL